MELDEWQFQWCLFPWFSLLNFCLDWSFFKIDITEDTNEILYEKLSNIENDGQNWRSFFWLALNLFLGRVL